MSWNDLIVQVRGKLDAVVEEFVQALREEIVNYDLIFTGRLYNDIQVLKPSDDIRIVSLPFYAEILNRGTVFPTQPSNLKVIFFLIKEGILDPDKRGPLPGHITIPPRPFITKALTRILK